MPSPTEARLALRRAAAGARDRLANRQDAIYGLAGDGNGNVTVPGTALIPFRTLTGGRVLLAHNPSGQVWADGELVEAIPLDDRAPLGYRIHGQPTVPNLYARYFYSTTASPTYTPTEAFYRFKGGTTTNIGVPPWTGTYLGSSGQYSTTVSWDSRHGIMLDDALYSAPGLLLFLNSYPVPAELLSRLNPTSYSAYACYPLVRYRDGQWTEKILEVTVGGGVANMSPAVVDSYFSNPTIDHYGNLYYLYFQSIGIFTGGFIILFKIDINFQFTVPFGPTSTTCFRRLAQWFDIPPMYQDYWGFIASCQRSTDPIDTPILVGSWGTGNAAVYNGGGGFTDFTYILTLDATINNNTKPSGALGGVFERTGTSVSGSLSPFRPPESFWIDRRTEDIYVWLRNQLWRNSFGSLIGDASAWTPLYSYTIDAQDTIGYRVKVHDPAQPSTVFGWRGYSNPEAISGGLLAPNPHLGISGLTGETAGANPDGAARYDGPAAGIGATDYRFTLYRFDLTGRTAVWTIVRPVGTQGRPVAMAWSGRKIYVSVGGNNAAEAAQFHTNPHIRPGIYEVDPARLTVKQIIDAPIGFPGGWGMLVSEHPPTSTIW